MSREGPRATPPTRPVRVAASRYHQHDVVVDGIRLRYIDEGPTLRDDRDGGDDRSGEASAGRGANAARHPLVILPGHTARIEGFDAMIPALAAQRRVLVVDLPGSGYSDRPALPARDYTVRFYEDTVVGFLDALGIARAVPVGGSLGGNLVLRLGHRFPERFETLVLWAPGGAWEARPRLARLMLRIGGRALFWPTVRIQSRYWFAPDFPGRRAALDETFAYYREVLCPGFVRMYWGLAADQLAHSLFDIAGSVTQPTLLMWGDRDDGAGMGAGVARLRGLLPNVTFHVFPGARHSLEAEIPDALASTIGAYLDGRE